MIVHNSPALWQASKNEREAAMRAILCPFQSPATQHNSRIRGQQIISMSEKLSVPIFARSEYFWRYRARTVSHPRRTESSEMKTVDAERAYPFMNSSTSPRFQASCCARRTDRIRASTTPFGVRAGAAETFVAIKIQEIIATARARPGF